VRVLSSWRPDLSWTLQPGDMLYVPPHCGHEGVALSAGQTLSIGFLAPRQDEMAVAYVQDAIGVYGSGRYQDLNPKVGTFDFYLITVDDHIRPALCAAPSKAHCIKSTSRMQIFIHVTSIGCNPDAGLLFAAVTSLRKTTNFWNNCKCPLHTCVANTGKTPNNR
jgi:hypothetical protein